MKRKKLIRRLAEQILAAERGASVEYAAAVLRHEKDEFLRVRELAVKILDGSDYAGIDR